ncbi:MAG: cation:proton antiporter [Planctomycetota bacterium]|nr:cation:proton antiporter [Planctomycetota bacterium]
MSTVQLWLGAAGGEVGVVGDLVIVLVAASVVALVVRRLGMAVIPAFLLTGMALGPNMLGLVPAPGQLAPIGHLAIVVLLFGIGLELHLSSLRGRLLQLIGGGGLACGLCVLVGWGLTVAFGMDPYRGLAVAMALSLSSTAVVLKLLTTRRELARPSGRLAVAVLVVQDLAVVAMLASLPLLAGAAGIQVAGDGPFSGVWDMLLRLGAIGVFVIGSRRLMPWLLHEATRSGAGELLLIVGMAFALGAAWITHLLGFSLEMGAFLAGFLLSGTRFRYELMGQIVPIRDFFLAVFFTVLGMQLAPQVVAASWEIVLLSTVIVLVAKALLISLSCWVVGAHASVAVVVGFALAQAGEFSLVLLGEASAIGLLDERLNAIIMSVVVLTLLVTPLFAGLGRRLAGALGSAPQVPWADRAGLGQSYGEAAEESGAPANEVIIAGFGPVGRRVAADLELAAISYCVIDMNPDTIRALHETGNPAVVGDAATETTLMRAGLEQARALVITIPDDEATRRVIATARRHRNDLLVAARTTGVRSSGALKDAGADLVVSDELSAADEMAREVSIALQTTAQG